MAHSEAGLKLRAARLVRRWTLDDVAEALHQLDAEIGAPESRADLHQIWKWEAGTRNPGRRYQARLCVVFDMMPAQLGFIETPRLMRDIGDLRRGLAERDSQGRSTDGDNRLADTLRHLWPVDMPLLDSLELTARDFAARTETERSDVVLPDLSRFRDTLDAMLTRSQSAGAEGRLLAVASQAAELVGYAAMVGGRNAEAWRAFAAAEVLGREAGSGELVATVLAARSRLHSRTSQDRGDPRRAVGLLDAALLTAGPASRPALRAWAYGRRAEEQAELGLEVESGRDLEMAFRTASTVEPAAWNLFSDLDSAWLEQYRGARALGLRQGADAVAVYEAVLSTTDPRLHIERATALWRLAWAAALLGDVDRACALLRETVGLASAHGDRRAVAASVRVRDQHLARWRTEPAVRRLDEAIRAARQAG